ncbi:MAG: hypothetical protein A2161_00875 [Candidatus Schekmanbacteria bacterium RBG_13_48_7]|uniref:Putative zinc-finger domain-containing protein n=1 Tax=Candidatus Schekmanbacteria bacterium RBG_13_48_7 TaxID=1817878 RepID=A0A1F7RWL5_9BACT|nr:MAG: hypothetical protein A2161_00875 [Candidatus Schekmanbacteria bacterium RBG_13_48_7]
MNCRKFLKNLNFFAEGELDESLCRLMEQHVKVCPQCATEWKKTQKLFLFLNSVPKIKAPPYFEAQLNQRIENLQPSIWHWVVDSFSFILNRRFQWVSLSLCVGLISGIVLFFAQDNFRGSITAIPTNGILTVNHESNPQQLADIGYISVEEGSFQFPEIHSDDISKFMDTSKNESNIPTSHGIQPVNIMVVNF